MHPIAEAVDYFCALCYPANLQLSANGKNIFSYVKPKTKKTKLLKQNKSDIALPKEDIKVEKGQDTFLPALKKIVNKKARG